MKSYEYTTQGVCARKITFDMDDKHVVSNVVFYGGCNGNLQAISRFADGMTAEQLIKKCRGIDCGGRGTSCTDQLAQALEKLIA